jgi:uncharacterized protein (DUF849 family)
VNYCYYADKGGAAIIHLHGRNPETGRPDPRPEVFQDFTAQIAGGCDAVMNVSTGGARHHRVARPHRRHPDGGPAALGAQRGRPCRRLNHRLTRSPASRRWAVA